MASVLFINNIIKLNKSYEIKLKCFGSLTNYYLHIEILITPSKVIGL